MQDLLNIVGRPKMQSILNTATFFITVTCTYSSGDDQVLARGCQMRLVRHLRSRFAERAQYCPVSCANTVARQRLGHNEWMVAWDRPQYQLQRDASHLRRAQVWPPNGASHKRCLAVSPAHRRDRPIMVCKQVRYNLYKVPNNISRYKFRSCNLTDVPSNMTTCSKLNYFHCVNPKTTTDIYIPFYRVMYFSS